jgi:hypothetical protein
VSETAFIEYLCLLLPKSKHTKLRSGCFGFTWFRGLKCAKLLRYPIINGKYISLLQAQVEIPSHQSYK